MLSTMPVPVIYALVLLIIAATAGIIITEMQARAEQQKFEDECNETIRQHELEMAIAIEHHIDGCGYDIDQPVEGDYHPELEYE